MVGDLLQAVRSAYSGAAEHPEQTHPFPVGRSFAQDVGYPGDLLEAIPNAAVQAFTGVSNVPLIAELSAGDTVLDLGCGAGLDSLIAGRRVGEDGRVYGVDFSQSMLERARSAARTANARNISFLLAAAGWLPLRNGSIDVALVNGIFNLNPARAAIFGELARVLRPGGAIFGAELILREPALAPQELDRLNWFA
jgi:SAM-dependent methyltransferase